MGKTKNKKINPLYWRVDQVPANKIEFVDAILETIIAKIKEESPTQNTNYNFSDLAGTLKTPNKFDAVKFQRKLRDEWPD